MHSIATPEDMFALGQELAKKHKVLFLHGDLWAGKTLLTKGFAHGLGIDHNKVQSPTYAYLNIYDDILMHLDMYRLEEAADLIEKWIHEQLHSYEYVVIERPKFLEQLPFEHFTQVFITKTPEGREVEIVTQ